MKKDLARRVQRRAGGRCEYCRMPEGLGSLRFHFDQVIAEQHRGRTTFSNLALCCPWCNAHKGPNVAGIDPVTRRIVPLHNPRQARWDTHFRLVGARIVGLTPSGRATIIVLAINDADNLNARAALIAEGLY